MYIYYFILFYIIKSTLFICTIHVSHRCRFSTYEQLINIFRNTSEIAFDKINVYGINK